MLILAREKYYVNLQSLEISQSEVEKNHGITIYATQSEIEQLRKTFNTIHSEDFNTYLRAHVPIMPYHNARSLDQHDKSLRDALQFIYQLGDDQTKAFIEESGALGNRPIDTNYSYPDPEHDSHSDL